MNKNEEDNFDEMEEGEEDIVSYLQDQIDKKQKELKKIGAEIKQKNSEMEEAKSVREEIQLLIDKAKHSNKKLQEEIDKLNQKINQSIIINSKFIDKIAKSKNNFCNILKNSKELEENPKGKELVKIHENQNNIKILKTEKFKLIKHLGSLYTSLEDLFNIDSLTFDNFQHKTSQIKAINTTDNVIPENDIESYISVYIYFRSEEINFTDNEVNDKIIDLNNLKACKFSFLEYDKLFNITKKFSLLELKDKAYKHFEVNSYQDMKPSNYIKPNTSFQEYNNYILMDMNMKWWSYNLILYDEIERKNLEKGFILPNSKFFQINPIINDQFKLILVHKNTVSNIIYSNRIPLEFVEDSQLQTKTIKNYMKTLYSSLDSEVKLNEALKAMQYNTRKYIINNEIKEKLKSMLGELYDEKLRVKEDIKSLDLISSDRVNLMNDDKSIIFQLNDPMDLLNSKEINQIENIKKKKKPKKFAKQEKEDKENPLIEIEMKNMRKNQLLKDEFIDDRNNDQIENPTNKKKSKIMFLKEETKRPVVNQETLIKLREKYPEILDIFEGDLDNFMNYCQLIINEFHNKKHEFEFDKFEERENAQPENKEINDLSNMILDNIKNHGSLIKNKNIFYSTYETNKNFFINHMLNNYFKKENEDIAKVLLENMVRKIKEEKQTSNNVDISDFLDKEANNYGIIKNYLKILEVFLVISIFYLCYFLLNKIKIKDLSIFNEKILEVFDEKDYCVTKFKTITSSNGLNKWMIDCYMITVKSYLITYEELEKSQRSSIYIFHSDIQIIYNEFKNCSESKKNFENTDNKCLDTSQPISYYEKKKKALDARNLKVNFRSDLSNYGEFFDYLFFSRTTLDSPNIISINSKEQYVKFENFLNAYIDEGVINSSVTAPKDIINSSSKSMLLIENEIKKIDSDFDGSSKSLMAFCDSQVSKLNISFFFLNQDLDKIGVVVFKYSATDSNVSTTVSNYALEVDYSYRLDSGEKYDSMSKVYFSLITVIMIILIILNYLKMSFSVNYRFKSKKKQKDDVDGKEIPNKIIKLNKLDLNYSKKKNEKFIEDGENKNNKVQLEFAGNVNVNELAEEDTQKYNLRTNNEKTKYYAILQKKIWKTFNRAFFLSCAWITFIVEIIFRFFHIINGTKDEFFSPFIMIKVEKRDAFIFYKDNIKLFKAIKVLFLFVHLIYVIFSIKRLTIIRKLFQRGLIIFYIIIIIIILAISVIIYLILGVYFDEFNSLLKTFIWLWGYTLGVEATDNIEVGNNPNLKNYVFYVRIIVYFMRLIVINFTLIVMYVFYKKAAEAQEKSNKIKSVMEEEKQKLFEKIKARNKQKKLKEY